MKDRLTLQGSTLEKKLQHVEKILRSFRRRLSPTAVTIVPPIPIMNYIDDPVEQVLLRFMAPADGHLVCAAIKVEELVEKPVTLTINLVGKSLSQIQNVEVKQNLTVHRENFSMAIGDTLTLLIDRPTVVKRVWITALFQVHVQYCDKEKFLIEALEAKALEVEVPDA